MTAKDDIPPHIKQRTQGLRLVASVAPTNDVPDVLALLKEGRVVALSLFYPRSGLDDDEALPETPVLSFHWVAAGEIRCAPQVSHGGPCMENFLDGAGGFIKIAHQEGAERRVFYLATEALQAFRHEGDGHTRLQFQRTNEIVLSFPQQTLAAVLNAHLVVCASSSRGGREWQEIVAWPRRRIKGRAAPALSVAPAAEG